jgi:transcriptional regulator with XRE-family HTH domain
MKISDQLRRAIVTSGESRYSIAQATGVNQSTLSRFIHGGGLSSENLDLIAEHLGLELRPKRKRSR